ncbi:MAG: iron-containing redox enzyme family protein [Nitrospirae bacterium]|nr:MAG: iron-containing redox enzyme family protein [Nitrospirota bacterium]
MDFYDTLLAATDAERAALLATPFLVEGAAGRLGLPSYVAFLTQAYHHVRHTTPLLMACGSRVPPEQEWLREAMAHYIAEELGHQEWILKDLAACGADPEAVRHGEPLPETEIMVAYAYDLVQRRNPVGFLGMVLVLEGTSVRLAAAAADRIQAALGLPDAAFTYLRSHGSLDQGHIRFYRDLVNRLESEADRRIVVRAARIFYRLYGDIFRALPRVPAAAACG